MKRIAYAGGVVMAIMVCACGDGATVCGPNENDIEDQCVTSVKCGPGTRDDGTGACIPDATDCQNGTVLIGNACVDPTSGIAVDVEEGPEPNGLGVTEGVENSNHPAGVLMLKPQGEPLVVHGHLTPFEDADGDGQIDPDYDTYNITVGAPTLLDVSVDGVNGIDGGFYAIGGALGLGSWERFGVSITGDTAHRPLFLPAAGDYAIVVADTRSLAIGHNPPLGTGRIAAGDGGAQYYMSVTAIPLPSVQPVTVTNNVGSLLGTITTDDIQFFSVPMGLGFNTASVTITQDQANAALVVLQGGAFRAQGTRFPLESNASVAVAGFNPADPAIVVVDPSYNTAIAPIAFDLEIAIGDAQPLSTTGGAVAEPVLTNTADQIGFDRFNVYFFDVADANEIEGLTLHWSLPVDGVVLDQDRFVQAAFTIDRQTLDLVGNTFTDYKGALRFIAPGRYYFVVYPPSGTPGVSVLTATSTMAPLTATAVTENVPLTNQPNNAFALVPFTYSAGTTDIWQSFDVTGTVGNRTATFMDPTSAYGSLASLAITTASGAAIVPPDAPVVFAHTFAGAPSQIGRILVDDPTQDYLIAVSAAGAGNLAVDFAKRTFTDLGTVAAGDTKQHADTLTSTITQQLYLVHSDTGNNVTLTLPAPGAANLRIDMLNDDESAAQSFNSGVGGTANGLRGVAQGGFVAFRIASNVLPIVANINYTVTAKLDPGFYSIHAGTTAFVDVCATGTIVTFLPDTDDGLSAALDTPAGFTFYGAAAAKVVVSSNGWLSFDPAVASSFPDPVALPDGVGHVSIAPLWEDLFGITACTQTIGTKMIVQWGGHDHFGGSAQFQAILDGSNGSIEIVYGTTSITGSNAVAGVQHAIDDQSTQLGAFSPFITPSSSLELTHP